LNKHEDLVAAFGKNWKRAREHFYEHGFKEKRNYKCINKVLQQECPGGEC